MRSDVAPPAPLPDGRGLRLALVVARFNDDITARLRQGALAALDAAGVDAHHVAIFEVPGAFEVPLAARAAARTGRFDAVVCLGCVIRGATPHFEYVATAATQGILSTMLETGVPMAFGVLTTNSHAEAVERVPDGPANKGWEAAAAALEMARVLSRIAEAPAPGIRV
jgi:6,7-dimethyl-8-ribityllumazine synthase